MDKYEYRVKLVQIEKLVEKKDFVTAAKIADGIDWRKVKSVKTLCMISDVYDEMDRLEDSYEILNMAYDRAPIGRMIVYKMSELATRMHEFEEAIELYKEFVKIAPHDLSRYILKYEIYKERGSSVADRIAILEEFKSHEYHEQWSYELACLYEEAGMIDKCIEECDELILWFNEGEYVIKALELKMRHQALNASQQEKYEHRFDREDEFYDEEDEEEESFLEEPEKEAPASEKTQEPQEEKIPEVSESVEQGPTEPEQTEAEETAQEPLSDIADAAALESAKAAASEKAGDDPGEVPLINTDKFSTMNLQEELAKGLQLVLAQVEEEIRKEGQSKPEAQPESSAEHQTEEKAEEKPQEESKAQAEAEKQELAEPEPAESETPAESKEQVPVQEEAQTEQEPVEQEPLSETAELHSELLKYAQENKEPKKLEDILQVEEDGQLGLSVAAENMIEKQITGQMTIEEILEAWEEKKRQAKAAMEASAGKKPTVLCETGEITSILEDVIPRTPKDVQKLIEELEAESNASEEEASEEVSSAEVVLEDDLPVDLDLEDVLVESLEQEEEEIQEEPEAEDEEIISSEEQPEENEISDLVESIETQEKDESSSMIQELEKALAEEFDSIESGGRPLTDEQEKLFAYFMSVRGMRLQLSRLLEEDEKYENQSDSSTGNVIVTGVRGNGKTTLAIDIVKAFQKQRKMKGGKIAKVTGEGLNKKEPLEIVQKLGKGALIIERAGEMNSVTVSKLSETMKGETGGLLIILEDEMSEISQIFVDHEEFGTMFNRMIEIPIFTNDELVTFGKSYAEEQEFYFEEMAVLALYDRIGISQTAEHVVNVTEVKELVDKAIERARKQSRKIFVRLSKKRVDEFGNMLLLEEDFRD